jgi:hypothetical protein
MANESYSGKIQSALDEAGNTLSVEDVLRAVDEGRYQLWAHEDSVVVTEILEYPQAKVLNFLLAAGSSPTLSKMCPVLEAWGSEVEGCRLAATTGRRGWERSFLTKEHGWKATHVVLTKEL